MSANYSQTQTSLRLLAPKTTASTWIHFSEPPRTDNLVIEIEDDGYQEKCNEALHFAVDNRWLDTNSDYSSREYKHKYELVNYGELNILDVSRENVFELLPLPLGSEGMDFKTISKKYDGILIHHDEIYYGEPLPNGYTRWRYFVHKYEIDTLVVWRGARLKEVVNDWPQLSEERLAAKAAKAEQSLKYKADEAAKLAALPDDEARKEKKRQWRKSTDNRLTRDAADVAKFREYFVGYDEHYPVRPPGFPRDEWINKCY
jgi:hypothetical protein